MSDSIQTPAKPGLYREDDARAPAAEKATAEMRVEITDKAAEKARAMLLQRGTPDACVRLGVKGGGCTGLAYVLAFEDRPPRATDRVFEKGGFRVVVDPKSLVYLNGTVLDWAETLMKTGFQLMNPNEKKACGCGESFTV